MNQISNELNGNELFDIRDFNHIEFFVGNAKQAAFFYIKSFERGK